MFVILTTRDSSYLCDDPDRLSSLDSVLSTNRLLRDCMPSCFGRRAQIHASIDSIRNFTVIFDKGKAARIQNLVIDTRYHFEQYSEQDWGKLLKTFTGDLPNLSNFELLCWCAEPFTDLSEEFQWGWFNFTGRRLLRFVAFLNLRHPSLGRAIYSAGSGPELEDGRYRLEPYIIMDKGKFREAGDIRRRWNSLRQYPNEKRPASAYYRVGCRRLPPLGGLADAPIG